MKGKRELAPKLSTCTLQLIPLKPVRQRCGETLPVKLLFSPLSDMTQLVLSDSTPCAHFVQLTKPTQGQTSVCQAAGELTSHINGEVKKKAEFQKQLPIV